MISVRAASVTDIGAVVALNRDVQLLHAELEPGFFKSRSVDTAVAAFFATKLAVPENHVLLADSENGPSGYCGLKCRNVWRHP